MIRPSKTVFMVLAQLSFPIHQRMIGMMVRQLLLHDPRKYRRAILAQRLNPPRLLRKEEEDSMRIAEKEHFQKKTEEEAKLKIAEGKQKAEDCDGKEKEH